MMIPAFVFHSIILAKFTPLKSGAHFNHITQWGACKF